MAAPAAAQSHESVRVNQYQPAELGRGGFAISSAEVPAHLAPDLQLHLDYSNDPLVFEDTAGVADSERRKLVAHQLTANLIGALGLFGRVALFLGLPVHLVLTGDRVGAQPSASGTGLGDLLWGGRVRITGPDGPLQAAFQLAGTFHTGSQPEDHAGVAGESGATLSPELLGQWQAGRLRMTVNVGMRLRRDKQILGTRFSDELTYGLGVRYAVLPATLDLHAELFGQTPLDDVGTPNTSPLEALLGPKLTLPTGLRLGVAGGIGLSRGYGAPDVRVVATASYQWDPVAPAPQARREPAEPDVEADSVAGQPDTNGEADDLLAPAGPDAGQPLADDPAYRDSDSDGRIDIDDDCPQLPGPEAQRGCPETLRLEPDTGQVRLLSEVDFDRGRASLRKRSGPVLQDLVALLTARSTWRVRLLVHASPRDRRIDALGLSRARADALRAWLVQQGIADHRFDIFACGDRKPPAHSSLRHQGDGRVEAWVVRPLPPAGMPSTLACQEVAPQAPPTTAPATQAPATTAPPTGSAPAAAAGPAGASPPPATRPPATTRPDPDPDGDGLFGGDDQCPAVPGDKRHGGCARLLRWQPGKPQVELLREVKFDDGKTSIRGRSAALLKEIRALLRANPTMRLRVEGHAGDARDADLAAARATSVVQALVGEGVEAEQLHPVGCGSAHPIAPLTVAWGRKKNARIELHLLDPAPSTAVPLRQGCKPSE